MQPESNATLHENPETAPSVPIARSRSTRMASGHRRANSEWTPAHVVTNMYRNPGTGMMPLSPGLVSPTGRGTFFANSIPLAPRAPSGSSVPTIAETGIDKESAEPANSSQHSSQQRDSKFQ